MSRQGQALVVMQAVEVPLRVVGLLTLVRIGFHEVVSMKSGSAIAR